jgi:hypothetical protein
MHFPFHKIVRLNVTDVIEIEKKKAYGKQPFILDIMSILTTLIV